MATVGQVLLTVYLPILIGQAVDASLETGFSSSFWLILWQMGLVALANTLLQWISPLLSNQLVYQLVTDLRQRIFEKLHSLPLAYLDKQGLGDLVARISSDSEQLTNGLLMIFQQFFLGFLTIFVMIFTMIRLDTLMTMVVVILTPLSLFIARFIAQKSFHYYRKQIRARGDQVSLLEESMSQLSLIQAFNAQEEFVGRFKGVNDQYAIYSQAAIFSSSTVNPSTRFVNALIYALLAGLGALRIMNGSFTVGSLTTFLNYASQYSKPFNDISSVLSELQSALACAERIFALLGEADMIDSSTRELKGEAVVGHIEFKDVDFSYQIGKTLINNLNLSVPAGDVATIIGSNWSW